MSTPQHDTKATAQNVYDNPVFFSGYKALRDNDSGLNGVLEIPALRAALPPLNGKDVLDIGCGFGDFARYARKQGASSVFALDVSQKMLEAARAMTSDPAISYHHCPIEDFEPPAAAFDIAVSSLALHYVQDYAAVTKKIFATLRSGGRFVFTVEHPIMTASPELDWNLDKNGQRLYFPLLGYQHQGERNTEWFIDNVRKYHRTIETYVNTLLAAGFRLQHLAEPVPVAAAMAVRDDLRWQLERPPFLLLSGVKP